MKVPFALRFGFMYLVIAFGLPLILTDALIAVISQIYVKLPFALILAYLSGTLLEETHTPEIQDEVEGVELNLSPTVLQNDIVEGEQMEFILSKEEMVVVKDE